MVENFFFSISLISFLLIGVLLATAHAGLAGRVVSYLFLFLLVGVSYGFFKYKKYKK